MIWIEQTGRHEIHISFDRAGATDLAAAFAPERRMVQVSAAGRFWGSRGARAHERRDALLEVVIDEERDELVVAPDRMQLSLDTESADAIASRLRAVDLHGFFPAEMIEVTVSNGGGSATIYGELVANPSGGAGP